MQIIVELSPTTYDKLHFQAQNKGLSVAEIAEQLIEESEEQRRVAVFEQMRAEGVFLPKQSLPPDYQRNYSRIDVQGKPVSECIIEDRR